MPLAMCLITLSAETNEADAAAEADGLGSVEGFVCTPESSGRGFSPDESSAVSVQAASEISIGQGFCATEDEMDSSSSSEAEGGLNPLPIVLQPQLELRNVGSGISQEVGEILLYADVSTTRKHAQQTDEADQSFFHHVFGDVPRAVMPIMSEAKALGTTSHRLHNRLASTAMAIHCIGQIYWGSMCSWVATMIAEGRARPIAYIERHMQDETPCKVSAAMVSGKVQTDADVSLHALRKVDNWEIILHEAGEPSMAL